MFVNSFNLILDLFVFEKIKKWFLKPYPFPTTIKSKILISLSFGSFVFLFLYMFKPFGFEDLKDEMFMYAIIYGLITMSVMLVCFIIFPVILKNIFDPNKWNVYKMILFVLGLVLFISIANTLFSHYSNLLFIETNRDFLWFIGNTFLVGIFPIMIYVFMSERIIAKKYQLVAESILEDKKLSPNIIEKSDTLITLYGDNKKEELELLLNNMLYISFDKNYASIYFLNNGVIKETLLRISLNKIENQLTNFKYIVRCHKSYIVNTKQVEDISGNARGYLLKIANTSKLIPVSRSFPKDLLNTLVN